MLWEAADIAVPSMIGQAVFPRKLVVRISVDWYRRLEKDAVKFTNYLYPLKDYKGTHDIGFMVNCSYGNAHRLSPADTIRQILVQTADNLCGRFDSNIGCIRSWDFGKWNFPVIIDNMMNLDLLFYVNHLTNDPKYKEVALKHAETTMKNHFRNDHSSYHVVSYNSDGSVEMKCTHQGKMMIPHGRADKLGEYMDIHLVIASRKMQLSYSRLKISRH